MMLYENVKMFIDENVLHSESFDTAPVTTQKKAINNAEKILLSIYKRFNEQNPLPIDAIAYQAIYLLVKDDSDLRGDRGATYVGYNGVAINISQTYRSVAPDVIRILGRRTGSYARYVSDTNRGVMLDTNE